MKNKLIFLIFFYGFSIAYSQNAKYEKWLQPNYFRGYNILYENLRSLQDFIDFRNYGGNLFQIGTDGFMAEDSPYGIVQTNIDAADLLVNYCRQAGIHYTIAVRTGPGAYDTYDESQGYTGESRIWNSGNTTEQQLYADMLKMIAERYAGDTLFVGLNLVVEPRPKVRFIPANNSTLYKYFLENVYNIHMNEVYQFFINEIRGADAEMPLIIENFAYSTPELFPSYELSDPYLIYDAHLYQPKEYTNAGTPFSATYPGTYWNITYLSPQYYDYTFMRETILSRLKSFQETVNTPVLLGEFGIYLPQIGVERYISDVMNICKDYGWHFAFWTWRGGSPGSMTWNIEEFISHKVFGPWYKVLTFFHAPQPPTLKDPQDSMVVSGTPVFSWQSLHKYARYDAEVSDGRRVYGRVTNIFDSIWTYDGIQLQEGRTYHWRVKAKNPGGTPENESDWSEERVFYFQNSSTQSPVLTVPPVTNKFKLYDNYPNPFNPVTSISYEIAAGGFVNLKIYNILGEEVKVLVNEYKNAGGYSIQFNASNLPSGVYFYVLNFGVSSSTLSVTEKKKMVLVK